MLANVVKLAIISVPLWLLASSADAESIHRRCVKSKDPVRCSCAMNNGGYMRRMPDGRRRIIISDTGRVNERHARCMLRNGRS
jgi:hypothetical protein